jgi:predicted nuclease of restriction endonuclease-like (RecB) superfamily
LSWSHSALLPFSQPFQREFYAEIVRIEGWSVRTFGARIDSMLYERTALSKQPDAMIRQGLAILGSKGDLTPALLLKDPYFWIFCGLPTASWSVIWKTPSCGSWRHSCWSWVRAFVARQKRIQLDGDDFYIDLLFYNRKLRRMVVVELKPHSLKPEYKGQMELYLHLRWLAQNEHEPEENLPLSIILCANKNTEQIELLELGTAGIHVAEYLTVLPSADVLREDCIRPLKPPERALRRKLGRSHRGLLSRAIIHLSPPSERPGR